MGNPIVLAYIKRTISS